jgi:hypothetical protein
MVPPGGRLPPGGPPGGFPPGGGGIPPRGPGFGPAAAGAAAAAFGAPALISAARAGNDRAQDAPGLPPPDERRYVPDEVLFIMSANAPQSAVRNVVRRFNLTLIAAEESQLVGTVVHRYRIPNRTTVPAAIRAMSRTRGVGYVQPNYRVRAPNYEFRVRAAVGEPQCGRRATSGCNMSWMRSACRRRIGSRAASSMPIAVIDSGVDADPSGASGRVTQSLRRGRRSVPGPTSTAPAWSGAIVAAAPSFSGVSPGAEILAVRAFAPGQSGRARPAPASTSSRRWTGRSARAPGSST